MAHFTEVRNNHELDLSNASKRFLTPWSHFSQQPRAATAAAGTHQQPSIMRSFTANEEELALAIADGAAWRRKAKRLEQEVKLVTGQLAAAQRNETNLRLQYADSLSQQADLLQQLAEFNRTGAASDADSAVEPQTVHADIERCAAAGSAAPHAHVRPRGDPDQDPEQQQGPPISSQAAQQHTAGAVDSAPAAAAEAADALLDIANLAGGVRSQNQQQPPPPAAAAQTQPPPANAGVGDGSSGTEAAAAAAVDSTEAGIGGCTRQGDRQGTTWTGSAAGVQVSQSETAQYERMIQQRAQAVAAATAGGDARAAAAAAAAAGHSDKPLDFGHTDSAGAGGTGSRAWQHIWMRQQLQHYLPGYGGRGLGSGTGAGPELGLGVFDTPSGAAACDAAAAFAGDKGRQRRQRLMSKRAAEFAQQQQQQQKRPRQYRKQKCQQCWNPRASDQEGGRPGKAAHCKWGQGYCQVPCAVCGRPMDQHAALCAKPASAD